MLRLLHSIKTELLKMNYSVRNFSAMNPGRSKKNKPVALLGVMLG